MSISIPGATCRADAQAVHGLTTEFLRGKPVFGAVAEELLAFIGDARSSCTMRASISASSIAN